MTKSTQAAIAALIFMAALTARSPLQGHIIASEPIRIQETAVAEEPPLIRVVVEPMLEIRAITPKLEEMEKRNLFYALDIPLSPELQEHTWKMCQKYATSLPADEFFDLTLRVMWHESRYIANVPDNYNRNGTVDRGLMQINSCNWNRLKENYNLDVNIPEENIEAGVLMLSALLEEYPVEHALTAYAHGKAGARRLGGECDFSDVIVNLSAEVYKAEATKASSV